MEGFPRFELADAKGVLHKYTVTPHGADDGQDIMFALVGLGAEPLAQAAAIALGAGDVKALLAADAAGLSRMLATVDVGKVGANIRGAIQATKMGALTKRILAHTFRDGQPVPALFDAAYTANYGEMLRAVWEVVRINGFLPLPATGSTGSSAPASP